MRAIDLFKQAGLEDYLGSASSYLKPALAGAGVGGLGMGAASLMGGPENETAADKTKRVLRNALMGAGMGGLAGAGAQAVKHQFLDQGKGSGLPDSVNKAVQTAQSHGKDVTAEPFSKAHPIEQGVRDATQLPLAAGAGAGMLTKYLANRNIRKAVRTPYSDYLKGMKGESGEAVAEGAPDADEFNKLLTQLSHHGAPKSWIENETGSPMSTTVSKTIEGKPVDVTSFSDQVKNWATKNDSLAESMGTAQNLMKGGGGSQGHREALLKYLSRHLSPQKDIGNQVDALSQTLKLPTPGGPSPGGAWANWKYFLKNPGEALNATRLTKTMREWDAAAPGLRPGTMAERGLGYGKAGLEGMGLQEGARLGTDAFLRSQYSKPQLDVWNSWGQAGQE